MTTKEKPKVMPHYIDSGYGFKICGGFSIDAFKSALRYKPRPDDLFLVTYPKCGTTWVQNIVGCIFREGKPFETAVEFMTSTPFLEMAGAEAAETMKRPGAIKLHLPFYFTPWSSQAKYIFIARNPKDCVVSFFYHTKNLDIYKFQNGEFDDFFELFMEGKCDCGDYFDTVLSWYEHRNDPNVLFLTYEDLKKDIRGNVLKIAEFLGDKYKKMLDNDSKMVDDVIKYSSFNYMKSWMTGQFAELSKLPSDMVENHPDIPPGIKYIIRNRIFETESKDLIRKGIVGDYKNHLSPEQNRRLEEKFRERTKGTDIAELWKDIM